jgi:hypothetical protein
MTNRTTFEQMLEYLISEDHDTARELFHQLVVEKSREIYENILAEDFSEAQDDETGSPIGGDQSDDFLSDIDNDEEGEFNDEEGDDFGGEGDEEGDLETRVVDVEDELEELRAEFDRLMADESGESEHDDEFNFDDEGDEGDEEGKTEDFMREYIEKVSAPKMGDNGANTKSIVAKKNNMGGTTANLRGGESKGEGTKGGLANPASKEENFGNINVPGGKAGKSAFKRREPGHGAEKKGSGDAGDKGAISPINGVKSRAK